MTATTFAQTTPEPAPGTETAAGRDDGFDLGWLGLLGLLGLAGLAKRRDTHRTVGTTSTTGTSTIR